MWNVWFPPKTHFADTPVEGWIIAYNGDDKLPYTGSLSDAKLIVAGPAKADRQKVRLSEGAGSFILSASESGKVTIKASTGDFTAQNTITFTNSVPQPYVLWRFEEEKPNKMTSHWTLTTDSSIRANQRVASIKLDGTIPTEQKREVLILQEIPEDQPWKKENISDKCLVYSGIFRAGIRDCLYR